MEFANDEAFARQMDERDPLRRLRDQFHLPRGADGEPLIYFVGNSLGLMPKTARAAVEEELDDWERLAVDAHLGAKSPWYTYHEFLREPLARLVGARPHEVIAMNSLTVNLHLMLATFYQPTPQRFKILMEDPGFPSDTYAVKSQIEARGFSAKESFLLAKPHPGEFCIRQETMADLLEKHGDKVALALLPGVNFFTGQFFDLAGLTKEAQARDIVVGVDLAHAVGNVPLELHDWNVDFAVWCSYKYLNGGPGAIGGAFVHERHARNIALPRLAGWFGNDPKTRFRMQLEPEFVPVPSADAWQVSNPPIFAMAPLRSSLRIFEEAGGMKKLRAKSIFLTGYLQFLLDEMSANRFTVITPRDPGERGAQLSIVAHQGPREIFARLERNQVKCDFREPNVIRVAPTPLYNTFSEVWRFARILAAGP